MNVWWAQASSTAPSCLSSLFSMVLFVHLAACSPSANQGSSGPVRFRLGNTGRCRAQWGRWRGLPSKRSQDVLSRDKAPHAWGFYSQQGSLLSYSPGQGDPCFASAFETPPFTAEGNSFQLGLPASPETDCCQVPWEVFSTLSPVDMFCKGLPLAGTPKPSEIFWTVTFLRIIYLPDL